MSNGPRPPRSRRRLLEFALGIVIGAAATLLAFNASRAWTSDFSPSSPPPPRIVEEKILSDTDTSAKTENQQRPIKLACAVLAAGVSGKLRMNLDDAVMHRTQFQVILDTWGERCSNIKFFVSSMDDESANKRKEKVDREEESKRAEYGPEYKKLITSKNVVEYTIVPYSVEEASLDAQRHSEYLKVDGRIDSEYRTNEWWTFGSTPKHYGFVLAESLKAMDFSHLLVLTPHTYPFLGNWAEFLAGKKSIDDECFGSTSFYHKADTQKESNREFEFVRAETGIALSRAGVEKFLKAPYSTSKENVSNFLSKTLKCQSTKSGQLDRVYEFSSDARKHVFGDKLHHTLHFHSKPLTWFSRARLSRTKTGMYSRTHYFEYFAQRARVAGSTNKFPLDEDVVSTCSTY